MTRILRAEEIFDAAHDDALFDQLAARLAQLVGARSGVLHWRRRDDAEEEEEVSYSGYFSAADMARFEGDFARDDLWSVAINRPEARNRLWKLQDLVAPDDYAGSRIYNEWIRVIGDDTAHALGAAIDLPEVTLELGFHRGKSQRAFDGDAVAQLEQHLPAIRSMLTVRQKLRGSRAAAAAAALDLVAHASVSLSPSGRILHMNRAAEALVRDGGVIEARHGQLRAAVPVEEGRLAAAIAAAAAGTPTSLALLRARDGKGFSVTIVPAAVGSGRQLVAVVTDLARRDPGAAGRLRGLYGLSQAEAEVAVLLAEGLSPAEIGDARRTSLGTVRAQVKAIASKLGARRQSEIVRAVLTLPPLRE